MPRKATKRPQAPNLKTGMARNAVPTSPPQTPINSSPVATRPNGGFTKARHPPPFHNLPLPNDSRRSNIKPNGNGPTFSFARLGELSPRESDSASETSGSGSPPPSSSSEEEDEYEDEHEDHDKNDEQEMKDIDNSADEDSSEDEDEEEEEEDEEEEEEKEEEKEHVQSEAELPVPEIRIRARIALQTSITIEMMSDFEPMDSDYDRLDVLRPDAIEYAHSDRSRSRSRNPAELDPRMMQGIRDLSCGPSSDEEEIDEDEAHEEFIRKQRELRMRKRRSHGSSLSKRTHSERGDSDREDLQSVDWDDDGTPLPDVTRRTRRKTGEARWSKSYVDFQGFPQPIHEVEETNTDEEVTTDGTRLFKELPYYMEVDSN